MKRILQDFFFKMCVLNFKSIHLKLTKIDYIKECRILVFATNSYFVIPIFLQADGVNLCYFKLFNRLNSFKHFMYFILGYKAIGIIKFEFVA